MRLNLAIIGGLILATLIVFWPVKNHDFVNLDDPAYVPENPYVKQGITAQGFKWAFTTNLGGSWHPVTWLSHMMDVQLFGVNPGKHHLMSVGIHAASAALLFLGLLTLTGARWPSAAVAAFFALHPLRVESVAWAAERKDVLSGLFFMLVLWSYGRFAKSTNDFRRKAIWYVATLLAFVLGLMSKPMLVSVPLILLLLDIWPLRRVEFSPLEPRKWGKLILEKLPFFIITAVFCWLTLASQHDVGAVISVERIPMGDRCANALNSVVMYCANVFWPARLNMYYAFLDRSAARVMVEAAGLIAVTALTLWRLRREPFLSVGWFWYLIMLVPVIGIVQVGSQARADRYTYLPTIGILIATVWLLKGVFQRVKLPVPAIAVATGVALISLAMVARHQVQFWKDAVTLCERSVLIEPRDARSHYNLGVTLEKMGDKDGAIKHFGAAIEISAEYAKAHNNLGAILSDRGDFAAAEPHFRAALQINTNHTTAHLNLARALANQGKMEDALAQLKQAPQNDRYAPVVGNLIADLLLRLNRPKEAIPYLERVAGLQPSAELQAKIATLSMQAGDFKTAVAHYREAIKLKPDWAELLNNLAWTLATNPDDSVRNGKDAMEFAARACELSQRRQPVFVITLAAAQAEAGQFDQAIATAQEAVAIANQSGNAQLAASMAPLLNSFLNRQPFRAPAPAATK